MRTVLSGTRFGYLVGLLCSGCVAGASAQRYEQLRVHYEARPFRQAPDTNDFDAPLSRQDVVRTLLQRNPEIESARRGAQAALARFPQVTALEDPMLGYSVAPLSVRGDVPFGQSVRLSQRFPFFGKRALQGAMALAQAEGLSEDIEAVKLRLALLAANLMDDYQLVQRSLEINAESLTLLQEFKDVAEAQYIAGRASQQDPLQAEVELALLEQERVALEADGEVVVAQLNGLLHRHPNAPLPLQITEAPQVVHELQLGALEQRALQHRPELAGSTQRLVGGEAAVRLAARQYFPDLEIMAEYNSMWQMPEHQWMLGFGLNIPLQISRRQAAHDEAAATRAQLHAEVERWRTQVLVEVDTSHRRYLEQQQIIALYEDRVLPAAENQVAAAEAGFIAGRNSFLALIEAERNLRIVKQRLATAHAERSRRHSELLRAIGSVPGLDTLAAAGDTP